MSINTRPQYLLLPSCIFYAIFSVKLVLLCITRDGINQRSQRNIMIAIFCVYNKAICDLRLLLRILTRILKEYQLEIWNSLVSNKQINCQITAWTLKPRDGIVEVVMSGRIDSQLNKWSALNTDKWTYRRPDRKADSLIQRLVSD
uniref:Uncharacterized protein n=1 Tax=Glossina brevipalpis TaxID=37001 RepID=A0A1A9WH02_9MUSC